MNLKLLPNNSCFTIENDKMRKDFDLVWCIWWEEDKGQNPELSVMLYEVRRLVTEGLRFTLSYFT